MSPPDDKPTGSDPRQERDIESAKGPKPLSRWLWILIPAFFLAYPLSIGPVARLARTGAIPPSVAGPLETYFYGPLALLCDLSDTLAWLLRGYVELWIP